jgi:hypothetical protein
MGACANATHAASEHSPEAKAHDRSPGLAEYAGIMERCCARVVDVLVQAGKEGQVVNIHQQLGNMTLDGE